MCTVVIDVAGPEGSRLLAVRDEDPQRPWDWLGEWWPETYPGVVGIRDRRAGGAWLAAHPGSQRLAVLLNRAHLADLPPTQVRSRGSVALDAVSGRPPQGAPPMHGFNLLDVAPDGARLFSWDGHTLTGTDLPPGVHMVAHGDLDDPSTPRIAQWLPQFQSLPARGDEWANRWLDLLGRTAELDAADDRAIIRDNRPHGFPTQSLLYCLATVATDGVSLTGDVLPAPARWG